MAYVLENPSYILKIREQKKYVKIVALGSPGSGKTTLMESIDRSFKSLPNKSSKYSTATVFDLVIINDDDRSIYIYGMTGSERFDKMRGIVTAGINIGLLVVDSTKSMTDFEKKVLEKLRCKKIPFLIVANKIDLPGASIENIREDCGYDHLIVPISARQGTGVTPLMVMIHEMIDRFSMVEERGRSLQTL